MTVHRLRGAKPVETLSTGANVTITQSGSDLSIAATASGAPADATYLVTTANATLSAEVVVGATPGGELGGTWGSPTVDATHSGSSHAAVQAAAEATAAAALSAHEAAADPHTGYQKESEKAAANGYASLNASTRVPTAQLGSGVADSSVFLRGDSSWASPGASSTNIKQTEVDFGADPVAEASFTITDADVSGTSQLIASVAYEAPTGKDLDELDMDGLDLKCGPGTGQFTLYARGLDGYVADKFKINYLIG